MRIARLDEKIYREKLWGHLPLTDFWRVGPGYQKRLQKLGLKTMGDVCLAAQTAYGEEKLFKEFGVNAELLIDHAWGWEPTEIRDVKAYRPQGSSLSSGQVLTRAYDFEGTGVVLREMAEALALELTEKKLVTDQIVLQIGYDKSAMKNYRGETMVDRHGRVLPHWAHGSFNLGNFSNSARTIVDAAQKLLEKIANKDLGVRRLSLTANHTILENEAPRKSGKVKQLNLFEEEKTKEKLVREHNLQEAELEIKRKFGKNAILKGTNFLKGATMRERNRQIGGHRA